MDLRSSQRRRARLRNERTPAARRRERNQGLFLPVFSGEGRRGGTEREPHHPPPRPRRRWHRRDADGVSVGTPFTVWNGARRRRVVRGEHRWHRALPLLARRDAHLSTRAEDRRPAGGPHQSSLDEERHCQPGRIEALRVGRIEQQRGRERNRKGRRSRRHLGSGSSHRKSSRLRIGLTESSRARLGAGDAQAVGRRQRARRARQ